MKLATHRFVVGRRTLTVTPAFDSYWSMAAERQRIFFQRVQCAPPPWTDDPVLGQHRFTNAYRASDRVSQYLINEVIYAASTDDARSTILRVLLFKIFNRVETWQCLESQVGEVSEDSFDAERLTGLLDARSSAGQRLYSGAYIMPSPRLGGPTKHANHLRLLARLLDDGTVDRLAAAGTLRELYDTLMSVHSFGRFLAFQFAIDLNYSTLFRFSEMDHVVAGPGALDGIAKCFVATAGMCPEDIIRAVTEAAATCFDQRGIAFTTLWGRPLQLIDCQNLFCEVGKYARAVHPDLAGVGGRTQIKQRYLPANRLIRVAYPPKWADEYDSSIPVAIPAGRPAA